MVVLALARMGGRASDTLLRAGDRLDLYEDTAAQYGADACLKLYVPKDFYD